MELSRVFNGKKFMWDGKTYTDEKETKEISQNYQQNSFEVELVKGENHCLLFTRRAVKETQVKE